ncbi:MAG TPA: CRISPR-associated endonuclease Cas6 [Candidatus Gastranaerophilales bacterium]|nr:CRISPR-associated endonuclease Cas6 [Candidatus Gastranaerophilales bacterium]
MVKIAKLILELDKKAKYQEAQKLRGFFANTFSSVDLFHNHNEDGSQIYRYPRIQYRFSNNRPLVIGFNEGAESIIKHYDSFNSIKIGYTEYPIMEKRLILEDKEIKLVDDYIQYRFATPWYALNQENYAQYKALTSNREKDKMLEKILTTNILRMCKELGYTVEKQIEVQLFLKPVISEIKDLKVTTFTGQFKTNIIIPEQVGLGKGVAKGFGVVNIN